MTAPRPRPLARFAAELRHLPRGLRLTATASGALLPAWVLLLVAQAAVPAVVLLCSRRVVDGVVDAVRLRAGWEGLGDTIPWIGAAAAALLAGELLGALGAWVRARQAERIRDHLAELVHAKSVDVDLAFHEAPEFHDQLHRAREAAADGPLILLESLGAALQQALTLLTMAAVLVPYGPILPLALVASAIPAAWVVLSTAFRAHAWRQRATQRLRRLRYVDELLTGAESAAELRLYGLADHFRAAYRTLRTGLRDETLALERRAAIARLGAGLITLGVAAAAIATVGRRALDGHGSVGDLVVLVQAFAYAQRTAVALLEHAGAIYRQGLLLGGLFDFLALTPTITAPPSPTPLPAATARTVVFDHVSFSYPGESRAALTDLDLELPAGKVTAVVGANGAGKSTLVKLVARLYDPTAGTVTVDGVDLRALDPLALRAELAVLAQEEVHFFASAAENIGLGDLSADRARIETAAIAAGADAPIARLPGGYDAVLGKWFGGTNLSLGEWRRLALARAFLRRASVILLDEPTSAMDSWAELAWLERFRALAAGRTALIVTHRFTTARRADLIVVMDGGRVVERGSHDALVAAAGPYARSWQSQLAAEASPS